MRDRFICGVNSNYGSGNDGDLRATGGQNSYALTVNQLPSHSHGGIPVKAGHNDNNGMSGWTVAQESDTPGIDYYLSTSSVGGGQSIDNRPSYFKVAFIMKVA
jgi:microcystin-dependent protein